MVPLLSIDRIFGVGLSRALAKRGRWHDMGYAVVCARPIAKFAYIEHIARAKEVPLRYLSNGWGKWSMPT
jgi:hypothetical protein